MSPERFEQAQDHSGAYQMAHVLFLDIVGYSLEPIDRQRELLKLLQDLVRQTPEFRRARQADELISLPTGDGMALAFLRDPLSPVRCAMELADAIAKRGEPSVRMGVHTGPVQLHADIREQINIVGGGINIAQRIMDCGDAGHVLVSRAVAEILMQMSLWRDLLHDLGEYPVKHGVMVHLYSLWRDGAGNPTLPSKLAKAAAATPPREWVRQEESGSPDQPATEPISGVAPGGRIGPYEIVSRIGAGGMGEVWRAHDPRLRRDVAIKVSAEQFTHWFEREARAVASLNHPNICQIYDVGPNYLVLEYIQGRPPQGPLPLAKAVRLAIQIAGALGEAHRKGVIHRDLKPANVLVTGDGTIKLLDFGLAKLAVASSHGITTTDGRVQGTPAYMSPEQASGKPLDERSDIFSFGAVLYEMLSGTKAFPGESAAEVLTSVLRDDPEPLNTPAALAQIVMRCLRKNPAERFQSAAEIMTALESISGRHTEHQATVAVLPFVNMSPDPGDEYFSDGLAEEITNALSHISGLRVTARTSSFAFRGKDQDIRKIADALGVTSILEGSVRRAGNRLRVSAQLINAGDGYHLWSERFERELTDVFAVQDEIAAAVTNALRGTLTGKADLVRPHEPNLAAWEAYLKGSHHYSKGSPDGLARAREYFEEAIALDPQWAEPHTALGGILYFLAVRGVHPVSEMVPFARGELRKALDLLPSEPGAHALLGAIAAVYDYDWKNAEEHFRMAMASGSPRAWVRATYLQYFLTPLGRFEEATEECAKVIALDPLNVANRMMEALTLACAGRYDSAMAKARMALALDDRCSWAHGVIAQSYFFQGRPAEALEHAEEAFRLAPWDRVGTAFLAGLLKQTGEEERAAELLETIGGIAPAGAMFLYHIVCSEIDSAIDWYERAVETRQPGAAIFAFAAFVKPLRTSSRWIKLASIMNLPGSYEH